MTGGICTPLQALSNGKENIVNVLPFGLSVLCAIEDTKTHESANIEGAIIGTAHYNPLLSTVPTTSCGTSQSDSYIVLRPNSNGRVRAYTTGKFTIPEKCRFGSNFSMLNPGIDPVTGKNIGKHLQVPDSLSKFDSNVDSDSDDESPESNSPDSNSSKFGRLTPHIDLNDVPQLKVQRPSPAVTPNSDNGSDSPPHLSEDDFDEKGEDSFSDAGDDKEDTTPSPEMSPPSTASPPSSSSEDEGHTDSRYPSRTRNRPPILPPGTVHPDGGLKQHHQAALEVTENALSILMDSGVSSSENLLLLKRYSTPTIWFNSKCAKAVNNFCPETHERVLLNALAKGIKTADILHQEPPFYVDLTGISDKNSSRATKAFCAKATPSVNVTGHANHGAHSTEQTEPAPDSMERLLLKLSKLSDKHPNVDNDLTNDFSTSDE